MNRQPLTALLIATAAAAATAPSQAQAAPACQSSGRVAPRPCAIAPAVCTDPRPSRGIAGDCAYRLKLTVTGSGTGRLDLAVTGGFSQPAHWTLTCTATAGQPCQVVWEPLLQSKGSTITGLCSGIAKRTAMLSVRCEVVRIN